jgi:hypothetical protein
VAGREPAGDESGAHPYRVARPSNTFPGGMSTPPAQSSTSSSASSRSS